jgi:hypothetical protein
MSAAGKSGLRIVIATLRQGQRIAALDDMLVETTPEPLAVALAPLLERRGRSQCECRDMAGLLLSWTNVRIRWKETCGG